jgi:ricin-type beta-trefoil lectin protein
MRLRLISASLSTSILSALLFVTSSNFNEIDPNIFYKIKAKHSGKCLAVAGGNRSRNNGDQIIQQECKDTDDDQKWRIVLLGDGFYKIVAKHSGKALNVYGGILSTNDGARVKQWDYYGQTNQMWKIDDRQGYCVITARHTGKDLEINGGPNARENGAEAQQWDDWGGDNQKWILVPIRNRAWAAMTSFNPATQGFRFVNDFINDLGSGARSDGLCGGMMYAMLDYYLAGKPIPRIDYRPAIGTPLQTYLYNRQATLISSNLDRFADMIAGAGPLADKKMYFERGLKEETLRELRAQIDNGMPVVLNLQDPNNVVGHSVLAIGYDMGAYRGDLGEHMQDLSIYVYDPNHPKETRVLTPDVANERYIYREVAGQTHDPQACWLTYFVDTRYRRTEAPAIFEPDLGGPDGLIRELRLTIVTGGDELIGGNDEITFTVNFDGRPAQVFRNINNRMRWMSNYSQTISLPLDQPVRVDEIRSFHLTKSTRWRIGGVDVWDLDSVLLMAYGGITQPRELFRAGGHPLARFTDHFTTFSADIH